MRRSIGFEGGYEHAGMSNKQRTAEQTAISISLPKQLLAQIDDRAAALGLNRSQYLNVLARNDLASRAALKLVETYPMTEAEAVAERKAEAMRVPVLRARNTKPR
jgi:metal-responsive CopG/Arc/MetJ family transcriptional regulator